MIELLGIRQHVGVAMNDNGAIRPDDVSEQFVEGSIRLHTRLLPAQSGDAPIVVIEGDKNSLTYLGKLILAQANYELDDGYGISPKSAGLAFFNPDDQVGLYILRLPDSSDVSIERTD